MAVNLPIWVDCRRIAAQQRNQLSSESVIPSSEWLKSLGGTLGVADLKRQDLEIVPHNASNRDALSDFFEKHDNFIPSRHPVLLLNSDET
jgi:hypothetical protein